MSARVQSGSGTASHRSGTTSPSKSPRMAFRQRSTASRNTGSAANRLTPIRCHCAPWPGNTKTVFGRVYGAVPVTSALADSPRAKARNASEISARLLPMTPMR